MPNQDTTVCPAQRPPAPPFTLLPLIALCLGFFMIIMDATAVNIVLPALGHALHIGVSTMQWVIDGYTLVFASTLLSAGAFGDHWGAKKIFLIGLWLFVAASGAAGLALNAPFLIAARFIQGLGAALVLPSSLTLIQHAYHERASRARAIGIWGGIGGIAAAAGPTIGGGITTFLGWRALFFINLPIGILSWWLTRKFVHVSCERRNGKIDFTGIIISLIGLSALVYGLIEVGTAGWNAPFVWAGITIFVVSAIVFVWVERCSAHPMVPLHLFSNRTFSSATLVGMILNFGFYGQLFVLSLYFQQDQKFTVLIAALAISPQTAFAIFASPWGGRVTGKIGPRIPMFIGLLVGAAGIFGLGVTGLSSKYWLLVLPMVATSFGTAFTMPATTIAILESVPKKRAGVAAGIFSAARQMGGTIGVALMGSFIAHAPQFKDGLLLSALVGGTAFLLGAVLSFFAIERGTNTMS